MCTHSLKSHWPPLQTQVAGTVVANLVSVSQEIVIARRFRGPPNSANGGYACGVLAEGINGGAMITLRLPPPLDHPLTLTGDGAQSRLVDGNALMGEGAAAELDLEVPEAPSLTVATEAARHYPGFDFHPFEECFVCGPRRAEGDGLRIFPGRVDGGGPAAAPWTPHESLRGIDGLVDRRYVWSALDCPSYFGLHRLPMALLGRLTARIDRVPAVEERLIAMGWPLQVDGRKHHAGSALVSADGELLASATAVWIELGDLSA